MMSGEGGASVSPSLGIGITVHNRNEMAAETVTAWRRMLPAGAKLVIVDDGSTVPFEGADHRFPVSVGIARAKNKCLELLDGCEHIFLSDDDCYPIVPDWSVPYTTCTVPHLAYLFGGRVIDSGPGWVGKSVFHGCLLYVRRNVLDRVGGMRPEFGKFGYEHVEWSRRIHNAGFTPTKYVDVPGSDRLWWSQDEQWRAGRIVHESSMGADRKTVANQNLPLLEKFTGSTNFVEYRE